MRTAWLLLALCTVLWTAGGTGAQAAQAAQSAGDKSKPAEFGSIAIDKRPRDVKQSKSGGGWWPVWCVVTTVLIALLGMITVAIVFYCIRRHKSEKKEKEEQKAKQPAKVSQYVPMPHVAPSPAHLVDMDRTQRWDWRGGQWWQQTATSPMRAVDEATQYQYLPVREEPTQYHNVLVSTSERRRRRPVGAMGTPRAQPSGSSLLAEAQSQPSRLSDMSITQADATSMHSMSETAGPSEHINAMAVDSD